MAADFVGPKEAVLTSEGRKQRILDWLIFDGTLSLCFQSARASAAFEWQLQPAVWNHYSEHWSRKKPSVLLLPQASTVLCSPYSQTHTSVATSNFGERLEPVEKLSIKEGYL